MMQKQFIILIFLIILCALSSSCTRVWTKEFLLNEDSKDMRAEGWQFDVDLMAYRMITGPNPERSQFTFFLDAINYRAKKAEFFYDIFVDNMNIRSTTPDFKKEYAINKYQWLSHPSDNYLKKSIYYLKDPYKLYAIEIPDNIDTLILEFDAILIKATRPIGYGYGYANNDTLIADTTIPEIRKHVQLKLVRHESCSKYPFFVRYFN